MKLLINNVEQQQPENRSDTQIVLYGRSPRKPAERVEVVVSGFEPYFYAREKEVQASGESFLLGQSCISGITYGDYESLTGDDLVKVFVPYPQDVNDAQELFDQTYAADVPFTNRFLIDSGIRTYVEIPDGAVDERVAEIDYDDLTALTPPQ